MESGEENGLRLVLEASNGPTNLARDLQGAITPQAISQWSRVPAERVLAVSMVTNVPCHLIRPDLYPFPSSSERNTASSHNSEGSMQ